MVSIRTYNNDKIYNISCSWSRDTLRKNFPYSELFWSAFCRIRTEYGEKRYRVSLRIQSECGTIRTRITLNRDTFHAVISISLICSISSFHKRVWVWLLHNNLIIIFLEKYSSCYILLTDQISLSGCLYLLRYWKIYEVIICVQSVTS